MSAPPPGAVRLSPPAEVRAIARRLEDAGHSTWAVGGAVRDALAGLAPGDWDLATAARPTEVRRLFPRTVPVGIEHGTVGVLGRDGTLYEVTTFRRDVETFGRRAVVAFADTLEEDLQRRDFTINAIAWHPLRQQLFDPHGGADDLRRGVLRTVGEPAERFAEDYLRILRALRFAGRYGLRIEPATRAAARAMVEHLRELSAERVREELFKVLAAPRPSAALELYRQAGVLRVLYPELEACTATADEHGELVWAHLLRSTDAVARQRAPLLRLAALLHAVGKPAVRVETAEGVRFPRYAEAGAARARELLRRLKCSNAQIDLVTHLVAQHASLPSANTPAPAVRRWLQRVGREHVADVLRLRVAACRARGGAARAEGEALRDAVRHLRQVLAAHPPLRVAELAIGGDDLRALGLRPGRRYGEILRALLERVTDEPGLNTRDALLALADELARHATRGADDPPPRSGADRPDAR